MGLHDTEAEIARIKCEDCDERFYEQYGLDHHECASTERD